MIYFIPPIGIKGFYQLSQPMDVLIGNNELFTCKALRNISDYLNNQEDPKTNIYDKYNIPSSVYEEDIKSDAIIASLQNDVGHWVNVPVRYFVKYPDLSGVAYKAYAIGISLPSFPVTKDFNPLMTSIINLVTDTLGVTPEVRLIETSREVLVPDDLHTVTENTRRQITTNQGTDRAKYLSLLNQYQDLQTKLRALEDYLLGILT
jgi:hypothetical protein